MGTITTTNDEGVVYYFGEVRKSSPLSRFSPSMEPGDMSIY